MVFLKKAITLLFFTILIASCSRQSAPEAIKNLGIVKGQLNDCPDMANCVSTYSAKKKFAIEPWKFAGDISFVKTKLTKVCNDFGKANLESSANNYLHFTFTTPWGGFVDDVEFLIDEANGKVHFRSASRLGYSDLGANRRRMKKLKKAFEK